MAFSHPTQPGQSRACFGSQCLQDWKKLSCICLTVSVKFDSAFFFSCSPARKLEVLSVAQSDCSQTVLPWLRVCTAHSVSSGVLISRAVADGCSGCSGCSGAGGSASQAGPAGVFHGPTRSVQICAGCGVGERREQALCLLVCARGLSCFKQGAFFRPILKEQG